MQWGNARKDGKIMLNVDVFKEPRLMPKITEKLQFNNFISLEV